METEPDIPQETISDNSELFQKIVQNAPIPMAILNKEGKVEYVNGKVAESLGYQIADVPNINVWFQKAYPDDAYRDWVVSEWNQRIKQALDGDLEISGNEYNVTCKDGSVKSVHISGCIVLDKVIIMFYDMTEFRQMQKALHESEQHYRMISELTTDYVYRLNVGKDGKITMDFISDNYSTITGRNKENSDVNFWQNFIHPDDYPLLMKELDDMVRKPQSNEFICRSYVQGNKLRWVQVFSKSELDPKEQRVTFIVGAVKDISERKNAEAELLATNQKLKEAKEKAEESNRLKTSFLQNMSHEIRTPMNAIMGFASLIADNYNDQAKLEKYSKIIYERCNDLLEIINGILDISKIESGQMTVNIEACNVEELFAELNYFFNEHKKRIQKEHIEFKMEIGNGITGKTIMTDQIKLKQILINLINNSFKFTEEGSVTCKCDINEKNELIFCVSDTGIGIPENKHEVIFERFVQLDNAGIHSYGGTGLGLSIVKGLVTILGGTIWLESKSADKPPKKGTTFYFSLPN